MYNYFDIIISVFILFKRLIDFQTKLIYVNVFKSENYVIFIFLQIL